ncbi:MAG: hypothetical protein WA888_03435 [Burkholderiaceae bacterium]
MIQVFNALKAILEPHTRTLDIKHDEPGNFYVDTFHVMPNKKPLFFGAVQVKKRYVSYHLMPVYVNPELLEGMSPELKKQMQGKSCFNFKSVDEQLFSELSKLTRRGLQDYRKRSYLGRPNT